MLSSEELRAWYERLNLSPETRSVIDQVRSSTRHGALAEAAGM